jgi:hypothetical protein
MSIRENRFRLQQWQLAERQRYLEELESLVTRLRGDEQRLDAEIAAAVPANPLEDRTAVHQLFVRPLIDRRDKLSRSIATLEAQIAETREAVVSARQEVRVHGEAALLAIDGSAHQRRRRRRA